MPHILQIFCLALLPAMLSADPDPAAGAPQPIIIQDWQSIPFIDTSDPTVITAANFATKNIKRGSLYKIVFAQKQATADGAVYILNLELVDIHFRHHRYSVQVFVPKIGNQWQVIYFTPSQY